MRHSLVHYAQQPTRCATTERARCRCMGMAQPAPHQRESNIRENLRCCATMTAEDLRCDECREWCIYLVGDQKINGERVIKNFPLLPLPEASK